MWFLQARCGLFFTIIKKKKKLKGSCCSNDYILSLMTGMLNQCNRFPLQAKFVCPYDEICNCVFVPGVARVLKGGANHVFFLS